MSLYKRGGVYWSYIWQGGIRYARSTGTGKIRAAQDADRRHKNELELKKSRPAELDPEMSFGQLFARFLVDGEVKSFHTERAKAFMPYFAEMPIGKITKNEIIRYAQQVKPDLLIMGAHGHKGLKDIVFGTTINAVRHKLKMPLLVVRGGGE